MNGERINAYDPVSVFSASEFFFFVVSSVRKWKWWWSSSSEVEIEFHSIDDARMHHFEVRLQCSCLGDEMTREETKRHKYFYLSLVLYKETNPSLSRTNICCLNSSRIRLILNPRGQIERNSFFFFFFLCCLVHWRKRRSQMKIH